MVSGKKKIKFNPHFSGTAEKFVYIQGPAFRQLFSIVAKIFVHLKFSITKTEMKQEFFSHVFSQNTCELIAIIEFSKNNYRNAGP